MKLRGTLNTTCSGCFQPHEYCQCKAADAVLESGKDQAGEGNDRTLALEAERLGLLRRVAEVAPKEWKPYLVDADDPLFARVIFVKPDCTYQPSRHARANASAMVLMMEEMAKMGREFYLCYDPGMKHYEVEVMPGPGPGEYGGFYCGHAPPLAISKAFVAVMEAGQ